MQPQHWPWHFQLNLNTLVRIAELQAIMSAPAAWAGAKRKRPDKARLLNTLKHREDGRKLSHLPREGFEGSIGAHASTACLARQSTCELQSSYVESPAPDCFFAMLTSRSDNGNCGIVRSLQISLQR